MAARRRPRPGLRRTVFRVFGSIPVRIYFAVVLSVFVVKAATGDGTFENPVLATVIFGVILAAALIELGYDLQRRRRIKRGRSRRNPAR